MSEDLYTAVANIDEVTPGTKKVVEVGGKSILICNSDDKLFAVRNLCSHADEPLECGRMKGGWIACPLHGARFDLATGEALNAPASAPVEIYPLRVVDGRIEILT